VAMLTTAVATASLILAKCWTTACPGPLEHQLFPKRTKTKGIRRQVLLRGKIAKYCLIWGYNWTKPWSLLNKIIIAIKLASRQCRGSGYAIFCRIRILKTFITILKQNFMMWKSNMLMRFATRHAFPWQSVQF